MTKIKSRKQKGKRLQNEVKAIILEQYPVLEPDDVRSTPLGVNGPDIQLSPAARKHFPYTVECKNTERINIWAAIDQNESNITNNTESIIVFSKNHKPSYVCITLDHFIELIKKQ